MALNNIEIIVGTYEEFVLGYKVKHADNVYSLVQTFANHSHTASVRCVTSNGTMLVSGGTDETVHLYDMSQRKESGVLMHHNGTVSCVEYTPNGSHILTGGDDGMLAVCRIGSYQVEKIWSPAHKSGVIDISVHPSGKLALSVGADATLRTWNLVKGRQAYATRLGSTKSGTGWQITGVRWGPKGKLYAVGIGSKVDVYSVDSAGIVYTFTAEMKISSFYFLNEKILCVGCENGKIYIHNVKKKCYLSETDAHEQRIKCLVSVTCANQLYVVSASSNGEIKLWKFKGKSLQEMCKASAGCRITCLTIMSCCSAKIKDEESIVNYCDEKTALGEVKDSLPKRSVPVRPLRKEVVVIEEENEIHKEKRNKRKKKQQKHSNTLSDIDDDDDDDEEEEEEEEEEEDDDDDEVTSSREKNAQKTKHLKASNTFKRRKLKVKKHKNSKVNSWSVTAVKR